MHNYSSIAAGVVLYHPEKDVIENINRYLPFVNKIFIADNSDEPANWVREAFTGSPKISFTSGKGNRGIAAALNECCENAMAENYTWILTMDQDSTVNSADFFSAFYELNKDKMGIVAASYALPVCTDSGLFVKAEEVITSGNLVNLEAWKDVTGFTEKLFIDEVDHDFCARLKLKGYTIYTSSGVFLDHHLGNTFKVYHKGRNEEITLTKHPPIRMYYVTRNTLYLLKTYFFRDRKLAVTRFKQWLIKLYQVFRFYPDRKQYYPYIWNGIADFVLGKYGKYKS